MGGAADDKSMFPRLPPLVLPSLNVNLRNTHNKPSNPLLRLLCATCLQTGEPAQPQNNKRSWGYSFSCYHYHYHHWLLLLLSGGAQKRGFIARTLRKNALNPARLAILGCEITSKKRETIGRQACVPTRPPATNETKKNATPLTPSTCFSLKKVALLKRQQRSVIHHTTTLVILSRPKSWRFPCAV